MSASDLDEDEMILGEDVSDELVEHLLDGADHELIATIHNATNKLKNIKLFSSNKNYI
jgi:hypothetical protein